MEALQAYFDGNAVKTLGDVKLKKNQKLIITVLDEDNGYVVVPDEQVFEVSDSIISQNMQAYQELAK